MKIGINALYLLPGKVGGTEIYLRNLVKGLSEIDTRNEYFIFVNNESKGVFVEGPRVKVVPCNVNAVSRPKRILWEEILLPFQVRHLRLDALFSAGMTAPFFCPTKSVLVIHDLQHVNQPKNFKPMQRFFLKTIIYLSSKSADALVAISECVKKDIVRHYRIDPSKVSVIYNGVDRKNFKKKEAKEVEEVRRKYSLPERFVLYIASSLPHKNYERLLAAYKLVREKAGAKLLLIGARDYGMQVIEAKINELGLGPDVVFLGWLPFEDIPAIYSAAEVFVFPSLHEGFGLPVIEAFSCGVPVVCSNIETLAEVAGGAALLVDPYDPKDIAGGILSVMGDTALRKRLTDAGLRRAGDFSWEKTARETIEALTGRAV